MYGVCITHTLCWPWPYSCPWQENRQWRMKRLVFFLFGSTITIREVPFQRCIAIHNLKNIVFITIIIEFPLLTPLRYHLHGFHFDVIAYVSFPACFPISNGHEGNFNGFIVKFSKFIMILAFDLIFFVWIIANEKCLSCESDRQMWCTGAAPKWPFETKKFK